MLCFSGYHQKHKETARKFLGVRQGRIPFERILIRLCVRFLHRIGVAPTQPPSPHTHTHTHTRTGVPTWHHQWDNVRRDSTARDFYTWRLANELHSRDWPFLPKHVVWSEIVDGSRPSRYMVAKWQGLTFVFLLMVKLGPERRTQWKGVRQTPVSTSG